MRSYLPAYDLRVPLELDEALEMMAREPGEWKPFAGGTDLMVLVESGEISDVRIALGSVASTVLRCRKTEALLRGRLTPEMVRAACEEIAREVQPIDDFRSTARYRRRVAQRLLEDFLLGVTPPAGDR